MRLWEWNQLGAGNGTNWVLGMEPIGYWEWNQLGARNGTNWALGLILFEPS